MASIVLWVVLVWLMCVSSLGFWFCAYVLMAIALLLWGFVTFLLIKVEHRDGTTKRCASCRKSFVASSGIPKIVQQVKHPTRQSKLDQRLTGSVKIDEHLQEMFTYISRDYINTWYTEVSSNREFIHHMQLLFKSIVNSISRNAIEVDWVSLFTKQLSDEFASHIRLYRQAEKALRKAQKEHSEKYPDLESAFFDFELAMEKTLCRDDVSLSEDNEKDFLCCFSEMLLYLLLPPEDYKCGVMRCLLRDLLTSSVLHPTVTFLSDPDYINQNIIWLCKDYPLSKRAFLTVIRRTDSLDELGAVKEIAKHETKVYKSKDTADKSDAQKCIESIKFVCTLANHRHQKLLSLNSEGETDSVDFVDGDWEAFAGESSVDNKLITLPFDIVLNNNIGLHYFTEFMTSVNAQGYVFFYHNIEAFRATAESMLAEEEQEKELHCATLSEDGKIERLREFAVQIFDTYLGENASLVVELDEQLIKKLQSRLKTERLQENFFDEVQCKIFDIMNDQYFSTEFKVSTYYVKLLAELELLPDLSHQDDNISSDKCDKMEKFDYPQDIANPVPEQDLVITELLGTELPNSEFCFPEAAGLDDFEEGNGEGILTAEIYNTGITHHAGKTFAVYAIAVCHQRIDGTGQKWFVVRRYSEFHDFHKAVNEKFSILSSFDFPSKKAFNNLSRHLMEKRRHMLNEYLQFLLSSDVLGKCDGLQLMIHNFLEPRDCGNEKKSLVRSVETFVTPIKSSVKSVGNAMKIVPTTLFGLKDGLVRALSRNADPISENVFETVKVSAGLDLDADDIPLRIILLLIDEVFDLKNKDQWFRRRIMVLLRQIIKTTQGNMINRKLTEYVGSRISVMQVAECLKVLSQAFWPGGVLAEPQLERNQNTKLRTRIMTKSLLLSCVPDELKRVIGSETTYRGLMKVYNMLQRPALNRRLLYVLLESLVIVLFPRNHITKMFERLHSRSPRTSPVTPIKEEHFGDENCNKCLGTVKKIKTSSCSSSILKKAKMNLKKQDPSDNKKKSISKDSIPKIIHKRKKSSQFSPSAVFYTDSDNSEPADDAFLSIHNYSS